MNTDFLKTCVKIRFSEKINGLVAVLPNGEEIPGVESIKVNSTVGDDITTATIELYIDTTEFVKHK